MGNRTIPNFLLVERLADISYYLLVLMFTHGMAKNLKVSIMGHHLHIRNSKLVQ